MGILQVCVNRSLKCCRKSDKQRKPHPARACLVCTKPLRLPPPRVTAVQDGCFTRILHIPAQVLPDLSEHQLMLGGVAASEAQTRLLCIPEMNFPCQICSHFWLCHLMTAFCFGVQHMCCCVYVNFYIYIWEKNV